MTEKTGVLRVGAVPFLNARPLVRYLDSGPPELDLSLEVPSRLTRMIRRAEIDVALLPSIEYFRAGDYRIIPDISISADGTVESVKIFSRVPIKEMRSLALDASSRTSVALAKILLKRSLGSLPELASRPPVASFDSMGEDAVLLIGDPAMLFRDDRPVFSLDLGEEWKRLTGLPFVYAMWVARLSIESSGLSSKLVKARDEGKARLKEISAEAGEETGIGEEVCLNYLTNIMKYDLGEPEIKALELFQKLAAEDGLCTGGVRIAFDDR